MILWKKASASDSNGHCLLVARLDDGSRLVRDSKEGDGGPILRFTKAEWDAFTDGVSKGEFD